MRTAIFLLLCISTLFLRAQTDYLINVGIGEEIPDVVLYDIHDRQNGTAKLRELSNDKLVILDFWATWCGACLGAMPKLDSIAKQHPNIELITVTRQGPETVMDFLDRRRNRGDYAFTSPKLFGDTLLYKLFPHRIIPHYVWIKDGKVMDITEEVTRESVKHALKEGTTNLRSKMERRVEKLDRYKNSLLQFLQHSQEPDLSVIKGYSLITGYVDRLGATGGYNRVYLDSVDKTRFTGVNMALSNLYRVAHGKARRYINDAAVEIRSKDPYFGGNELRGMRFEDWLADYGVSYELVVDADKDPFEKMVSDLQDAFPQFKAYIANTADTCLVLEIFEHDPPKEWKVESDRSASYLNGEDGIAVDHGTVSGLMTALEAFVFRKEGYPLIDATGYKGKIKINLYGRLNTLDETNIALHPYGLRITKKIASFDKLIIEDDKK